MNAGPANALCAARDLVSKLQVRDPSEIDIEAVAAFEGAPVRYAALTGCDGRLVRTDSSALITVRESIDRFAHKRFIIAHEIGHLLLHPHIRQIDEIDVAQTRNFNHRQIPEELEANYFAAELLMPQSMFFAEARRLEPSWDSISGLAKRYGTTNTATAIQFLRATKEAVFLVASERAERAWFVFSQTGRDFFLNDHLRLHRYSCAAELFEKGTTRSRAEDVPAGAWFDRYHPDGKERIVEDSMRSRGSSFVLSLLWIRDDI